MFSRNTYSPRLQEIKNQLRNAYGADMPLFDSYLRQSQKIENNKSIYEFSLTANNSGNIPLPEQLLQVTDGFYCYAMGFFLLAEVVGEEGTGVLQTYPNQAVFNAKTDLEVFYNAQFSVQINQTLVVQNAPMKPFRVVNTTIQSVANDFVLSESLVNDGFKELEPNLKLAGTQKIKVSVTIPTFSGIDIASTTEGTEYKLVCMPLGFSLPNGSQIFEAYYKNNIE